MKDRINQLFAEAEVARQRHATFYENVVKKMDLNRGDSCPRKVF